MKINGEQIINAIANRLEEEDVRCYDSAIVRKLKGLSAVEVAQLTSFGDVTAWHNERMEASEAESVSDATKSDSGSDNPK